MWSVKDHRDSNNSDIKSIDISSFTRLFLFVGIHFTRNTVAQLVLKCYAIFQKWSWFPVIDRFFFPHQNQIEDDQKSASKTSALYTSHVVNREKTMVQNHWQLLTFRLFYIKAKDFPAWFKKKTASKLLLPEREL